MVEQQPWQEIHIMKLVCFRCLLSWTVAKTLADIRRGMDTRVEVAKTPRVSGVGAKVANMLSKGKIGMASGLME